MSTVNEKMTVIADAIRERTGETELLTLDDMATDIPKVYEAGKKSQYDEFWDNYQDKGKLKNHNHAFRGEGWNDITYDPKYDMQPSTATGMFASSKISDIYKGGRINIDFSKTTQFGTLFYGMQNLVRLKEISTVSASSCNQLFDYDTNLEEIEKLILKDDGSQVVTNMFGWCTALQKIKIEGCFGKDISFSHSSKLTYESLMGEQGIVNALKGYSGTTSTHTLTLHADVKANLTEGDIATITQKGWTLA